MKCCSRISAGSGLVPALGPGCAHCSELNAGESSHCGQALLGASIRPPLTDPASQTLIQDNSGVLKGPAEQEVPP